MPRATYRVQLTPDFGFDEAARIAPYLHRLGVSHFYSSPYLQAAPGSTHGYDVVDPRRVNDELGGPVAHQRFGAVLGENDLGQVLDIVPNHMAISAENPWWWDVLENGPLSRYSRFFDVEWDSPDPQFRATVLLPVLGDHYGRVLEAGEIKVERSTGSFLVCHGEARFPVAPASLEGVLVEAGRAIHSDELMFIGESLGRLPQAVPTDRESLVRRHRAKDVLTVQLGRLLSDRAEVERSVDEAISRLNSDVDRLDVFLGMQNYRLAFWRAARDDLDYRRFFDVTSLAGLRMEDEHVFNETHELILGWLRDGTLAGVRVDHPDGLRDPKGYFDRLHGAAPQAWIVAEKILERTEELRSDWRVAGTTGYDFLNHVTRLFVDPAGEEPLTTLYQEFTSLDQPFTDVVYGDKQRILSDVLGSELDRVVDYLIAVVRGDRRNRDFARSQVRDALREVVSCMPVYRSYVRAERCEVASADRMYLGEALEAAANRRPDLPQDLFTFIGDVLLMRHNGPAAAEFVMRFQQLTAPVTAKGVEDTAFYAYNRLVALNEVGGDPDAFSESIADFHAHNLSAARSWPGRMLASSTHDTKRSEDVRIRIGLLSEMPERWASTVERWRDANARKRSGGFPDRNTEYLLYQTLVGAWPITTDRLTAYALKASREAKRFTTWTDADEKYERALTRFIERLLRDDAFLGELEELVGDITPAWHSTSLAQTLLRLTSPGVPDTYQGTEIWDLSLVDPDNRRPVDWKVRDSLLERASSLTAAEGMAEADTGLPKISLIHKVLSLRSRRPELFDRDASYQPVSTAGPAADRLIAFVRGGEAVTIVSRFNLRFATQGWADTRLELSAGPWQNELTGERFDHGSIDVGKVLEQFPVALLLPAVS